MKFIKYARRAKADFEEIIDYTAKTWGAKQAKKYIKSIRSKIQSIAEGSEHLLDLSRLRSGL